MNNANTNMHSPVKLMTIILMVGIVITVSSGFIRGVPFILVTGLVSTLIILFTLPMSLLVYWFSTMYKRFNIAFDFTGLVVIPLATSWWVFQGSLDCARNISCNLPGIELVTIPIVAGVLSNYYLIVRFRPRLYIIALSVMVFVCLVLVAIYFSPQILHTSDPWRFVG